jgi:hypothetical protein
LNLSAFVSEPSFENRSNNQKTIVAVQSKKRELNKPFFVKKMNLFAKFLWLKEQISFSYEEENVAEVSEPIKNSIHFFL